MPMLGTALLLALLYRSAVSVTVGDHRNAADSNTRATLQTVHLALILAPSAMHCLPFVTHAVASSPSPPLPLQQIIPKRTRL